MITDISKYSHYMKIYLAAIAGICMIIMIIFGFTFRSIIVKNHQLKIDISNIKNEIKTANNIIFKLQSINDADISSMKNILNKKHLNAKEHLPELLALLSNAEKNPQLEILSIIPQKIMQEKHNNLTLQILPISLQLKGSYFQLSSYLKKLLTMPFIVEIKSYTFSKELHGPLILKLEIKAYFVSEQ